MHKTVKLPENRSNFPTPASRFVLVFEPKNKNYTIITTIYNTRNVLIYFFQLTQFRECMNDLFTQK